MEKCYDAIVIGSGLGGLATASVLAQLGGKRVLVLEKHFKLGGFTHTFSRKGFTWDVGLHYVGGMNEGNLLRKYFDFVTRGGVRWNKMPHIFEKFVYPDFTFEVPSNPDEYKAKLIAQFPKERDGIELYFADLKRCESFIANEVTKSLAPKPISVFVEFKNREDTALARMKTIDYLNSVFKDEKLKALLTSQWGDYGLPPAQSAFGIHALIVNHYLYGGYYPVDGSKSIADSIVPIITEYGGDCLVNHDATEVVVENNRAVGVKGVILKGSERIAFDYRAPLIISNVGLTNTVEHLLPSAYAPDHYRELDRKSTSCVTLYLGLKTNPAELGFKGENYWIYRGFDHDECAARNAETLDGAPRFAYLSFPSLKNPGETKHTAEIISMMDFNTFSKWSDSSWKKRGADYDALKATISAGLLKIVEDQFSGFSDCVEYAELSTPLTSRDFTSHPQGAIYGIPMTPNNVAKRGFGPKTKLPGLLLSGADATAAGIAGVLVSGVISGGFALGSGTLLQLLSGKIPMAKHSLTSAERPRQSPIEVC